ncbi:MAG: transcription antitermination protein NusB [Candidatus Enteromonas sp.]|nr:transcription antitermination protein NusB [Candidatus Enteromonas sp.]
METQTNQTPTPSRNTLQITAMTAIYDVLTYIDMGSPIDVEGIVSSLCDVPYSECDYFVKANVLMVIKHLDEMKEAFVPFLRNWTFDRLPRVVQAILLLSYSHYYYVDPEVSKAVVIDVAVTLAKKYGREKDYKFTNGILDNVLKERLA